VPLNLHFHEKKLNLENFRTPDLPLHNGTSSIVGVTNNTSER
jgi:hypothetical protein